MTAEQHYTYVQAAQQEFQRLCQQITCDGRDPYVVACAMTERLSRRIKEVRALWDGRYEAPDRVGKDAT